jgi:hypothetical protein
VDKGQEAIEEIDGYWRGGWDQPRPMTSVALVPLSYLRLEWTDHPRAKSTSRGSCVGRIPQIRVIGLFWKCT